MVQTQRKPQKRKQVDSPSGAVAFLVPAMASLADTLAGHGG